MVNIRSIKSEEFRNAGIAFKNLKSLYTYAKDNNLSPSKNESKEDYLIRLRQNIRNEARRRLQPVSPFGARQEQEAQERKRLLKNQRDRERRLRIKEEKRLEALRLEQERIETQRLEALRLEQERTEAERVEQEMLVRENLNNKDVRQRSPEAVRFVEGFEGYLRDQEPSMNIKFSDFDVINKYDILDLILNNIGDNRVLMSAGNRYITLTNDNIQNIKESVRKAVFSEEIDSMTEFINSFQEISSITLRKVLEDFYLGDLPELQPGNIRGNRRKYSEVKKGGYFKWLNLTDLDLDRYGIFKTEEPENYTHNCFYLALMHSGMAEEKLNGLVYFFKNRYISTKNIKDFTEMFGVQINLKYNKGDRDRFTKYGQSEEVYNIGLIEKHYFIIEPVSITSFALKNYNHVKDYDRYNEIIKFNKNKAMRDKKRFIDSYEVVKILLSKKDELLSPIKLNDGLLATQFYSKFMKDDIESLLYDDDSVRVAEYKEVKNKDLKNVFFDVETTTNEQNHKCYLVVSIDDNGLILRFNSVEHGPNFMSLWMQSAVHENSRLIAHNATYDFRFAFKEITRISNEISKGNNLMSCSGFVYNIKHKKNYKIEVINSYNLIPMKLSAFKRSFDKDYYKKCNDLDYNDKQVMNYQAYTSENLVRRFYPIDQFSAKFNEKEKTLFNYNLNRWNLRGPNNTFDMLRYSDEYCLIDCQVLQYGWNTFHGMMKEITGLSINNFVSLASISHKYLLSQGVYDGVFELSGIPQLFISRCISGGRCMVRRNERCKVRKNIQDFDAVDLCC